MGLVDPRGKAISSDSKNPIVIAVDVTGSMASWPAEIFDRLPLLYQTLSKYKDDVEICFAAIGDANSDQFPLQVNNFGKGLVLEDHLKALCPEGGGGGQAKETYELFGYFMLNKANVPNASSPKLVIFGDEGFYDKISPSHVKHYIGDTLESPMDASGMWKGLQQKFDIYMLHKQYDSGGASDASIIQQWSDVLGKEKVVQLYEAERAVDVALGMIARQWGEFDDFTKNLSARQSAAQAKSVMQSLRHVADPNAPPTKSMLLSHHSGKKSKNLAP